MHVNCAVLPLPLVVVTANTVLMALHCYDVIINLIPDATGIHCHRHSKQCHSRGILFFSIQQSSVQCINCTCLLWGHM